MASVSSLDKDLRKLRLEKYTPAAASEARAWIELALGQKLPSVDLLEGLKDGVALCRLINLGIPPPGIRFKQSAMPFVQMENISHFLRACQAPPFNLHQHDMFLTVDLYEQKDPAQVLQCLGAFSRAAHDVDPHRFPEPIGPKKGTAGGALSPQTSGFASPNGPRGRGASINSNNSSVYGVRPALPSHRTGETTPTGRRSPAKSPTVGPPSPSPVSSWSKREHEGSTSPAWNIAQYGYMGGASQGNLGISFGGMRQITSAGPHVPSLAEKERRRKVEAERREEEDRQRRAQLEAEEEAARRQEERRWEEETERLREQERRKAQEEKQRWEEQERQWELAEERRRREEQEAAAKLEEERKRAPSRSDVRLRGQLLSQYQAEQAESGRRGSAQGQELEKELERARLREKEYERERQTRSSSRPVGEIVPAKHRSRSRHGATSPGSSIPSALGPQRGQNRYDSWTRDDEREYVQPQRKSAGGGGSGRSNHHDQQQQQQQQQQPPGPVESKLDASPDRQRQEAADSEARNPKTPSPRPLPEPKAMPSPAPPRQSPQTTSPRPLPEPKASPDSPHQEKPATTTTSPSEIKPQMRSPRPLPEPRTSPPLTSASRPLPDPAMDATPQPRQPQTKPPSWGSKSLLEREMEMERQRQQEWEEAQKETARAVRPADGVAGVGGRWDVSQWSGFTGGDSQNNGAQGIGSTRRQIAGPRPLPGGKR